MCSSLLDRGVFLPAWSLRFYFLYRLAPVVYSWSRKVEVVPVNGEAARKEAVLVQKVMWRGRIRERIMCAKLFGVPRRVILVASVKARNLRRQIPRQCETSARVRYARRPAREEKTNERHPRPRHRPCTDRNRRHQRRPPPAPPPPAPPPLSGLVGLPDRGRAGCATVSCAARSPPTWPRTRGRTRPGRSRADCRAARRARSRTRCRRWSRAVRPRWPPPPPPATPPPRPPRPPPSRQPRPPQRPRHPRPRRRRRRACPARAVRTRPPRAPGGGRLDRVDPAGHGRGERGGVGAGAPPGRAAVSPAAGVGDPGRDRAAQAARRGGARAAVRAARHRARPRWSRPPSPT